MRPSLRSRAAWAAAAVVVATGPAASAAPSDAEVKAARQLFAEASKDEDAARWADALGKLQQVAAVKLTAGVRYHLALCEEHLGHLALALDGYETAQTQAKADGAQDVLRLVGPRLADLAPRVPRITVRVTPQLASGVVKLDDTPLPASKLGVALPVDPGPHRLEATAEGRTPASAHLVLAERDSTAVDLTLAELPPPAVVAPTPPLAAPRAREAPAAAPAPASMDRSTTAPLVTTIGALALAGGGIAAYALAGSAVSSGTSSCAAELTTSPCTSQKNTVRAWDFTAAGAWTAAVALGIVSVVLWTRGPNEGGSGAAVVVGPGSAGVEGRF